MRTLWAFGILLLSVTASQAQLAQQAPRPAAQPRTCTSANNECLMFCQRTERGAPCTGECSARLQSCLISGTYEWRNRPSETNLVRQ